MAEEEEEEEELIWEPVCRYVVAPSKD